MEVVYADVLFASNFIINYLLLYMTVQFCRIERPKKWIAAGAGLGAVYAVLVLFPELLFLRSGWIKLVFAILMVMIAAGWKNKILKPCLIFAAVSAAFAGAALAAQMFFNTKLSYNGTYLPIQMPVMLAVFAAMYLLLEGIVRYLRKDKVQNGVVKAQIGFNGSQAQLRVLIDSGNTLRDPITASPVLIAEKEHISELFPISGDSSLEILKNLHDADSKIKLRLLPYRSVGKDGGLLAAFKPDYVCIDGKEKANVLVAISPNRLSDGEWYDAIIGTDL